MKNIHYFLTTILFLAIFTSGCAIDSADTSNGEYISLSENPQETELVFYVDDFEEYIEHLYQSEKSGFYYSIMFRLENFSSILDFSLENLKDLYRDLNETFDYVIKSIQHLEYVGYYMQSEKFVPTMGNSSINLKNQRVIDIHGNEIYITPINTAFLGRAIYRNFDSSIVKGRNFDAEDFEINSPEQEISVILGYNYKGIYDIGDILHLHLHGQGIDFKVIGFYAEGAGIGTGIASLSTIIFDNKVVLPFFCINYKPFDEVNYLFQIIYYTQKVQGDIRISTPIDEVDHYTHAYYEAVVDEVFSRNGFEESSLLALWPISIIYFTP